MSLDPELRRAYETTHYVVFGDPELVIRIGERNTELDALLEAHGASSAAYLTASNPGSLLMPDAENQAAYGALLQSQHEAGHPLFTGESRDPEDEWPPEKSVLVVGISREDAERVGRVFEQNAIVFVEKGKAPELVVLV